MKRIIVYLVLFLLSVSCKHQVERTVAVSSEKPNKLTALFSNPRLIYGSSFGGFFQTLYRNNQFDLMIAFTSKKSKEQFGIEVIRDFYKNKFKFDFKLGNLSSYTEIKDTIFLTYTSSSIYGTRRKIVINCLIENDSTKFLLPNLNNYPF